MRRTRQHVNPLGLSFETLRATPPSLAKDKTVEVEIGCAEAQFLFHRALVEPSGQYVGLEIRRQWVREVNRRAEEQGAPVEAVFAHANHHLSALFPRRSVQRVYVNFPDPWFKRRHRKRRLVDGALVEEIHGILKQGGDFLFQSDIWDLALDAMKEIEDRPDLFANVNGAWSFLKGPNPFGAHSARESHCELIGKPIWRILYRALPTRM